MIGVLDGVGAWVDQGIDSGLYSRELAKNILAAYNEIKEKSFSMLMLFAKAVEDIDLIGST